MNRLYLRIYVAMLASLAIFALLAAALFKLGLERDRERPDERALLAEVIAAVLPPPEAPPDTQRAALERWHRSSGADLGLFDAQRRPIAAAGRPVPAPADGDDERRGGREPSRDGGPAVWSLRLPDGRWAVARPVDGRAPRPVAWGLLLMALAAAVALGAYPVARRLARRLERLQSGVEALGGGDLSARVPVQGRDEVARLATRFNDAAARIEALVAAQRALLANASHELRSPLARLRVAASMLTEADDTRRDALAREVAHDVAELDALIDEILLASRLDAGAGIVSEPVDLLALLAEECARTSARLSIDASGPPAADRVPGATRAAPDPVGAATVTGDPRLLRRLLRNLLENARRHAAGSPIDVTLRAEAAGVRIDVGDRGPGVPEAERERIFEPFHRLAGHGESRGGVGLGLALVRQIARRHGADVRCLPRDGGGSLFRVTLPAAGGGDQAAGGRRVPTTTG